MTALRYVGPGPGDCGTGLDCDDDQYADLAADARCERDRLRRLRCSDGFCGAEDCCRCRGEAHALATLRDHYHYHEEDAR
ncbi:MAG: hypothetical protein QME96_06275 [Myxococcota bacterium]|nr:hypothetical protein [Myxococcota bacterium]